MMMTDGDENEFYKRVTYFCVFIIVSVGLVLAFLWLFLCFFLLIITSFFTWEVENPTVSSYTHQQHNTERKAKQK